MVVTILKPFGSMLKVKTVNIYDQVFVIHTKLTVYILIIFSIFVSTEKYFAKPINCITGDATKLLYVEAICWLQGAFINRNVTENGNVSQIVEYQKYYQWVTIVLVLQAFFSYVPAYLWKNWERGRMVKLCGQLGSSVIPTDYEKEKNQIVGYLRIDNRRVHCAYVSHFVLCEVLNLLIVLLNMNILNNIVSQFWIRYWPVVSSIFKKDGDSFSKLSSELFPKLVKCTYSLYGPSGTLQNRDALCLLSLNILNEKIFAFLYIWFIFLFVLSTWNLIARCIILVSPCLRLKMIRSLVMSSQPLTQRQLNIVLRGDNIGDWFVLFLLGRNLNPFVFREILDEVASGKEDENVINLK
ncbi:Innexin inx4 [Pseudolycoriella hygida]|uniref:Innexin n=1 Tax=Pseudolycoriella hygida TaxID=35572 RepID=A0A9Q0RUZ5_9DIPT|nr:Innexin inx4 [Pseudolycoriella hygida]